MGTDFPTAAAYPQKSLHYPVVPLLHLLLLIFTLQPTCCGFFIPDDPVEEFLKQIFYLYFTGFTDFRKHIFVLFRHRNCINPLVILRVEIAPHWVWFRFRLCGIVLRAYQIYLRFSVFNSNANFYDAIKSCVLFRPARPLVACTSCNKLIVSMLFSFIHHLLVGQTGNPNISILVRHSHLYKSHPHYHCIRNTSQNHPSCHLLVEIHQSYRT